MTGGGPRPESLFSVSRLKQIEVWLTDTVHGLVAYYLTSLIVVLGVVFGYDYLNPAPTPLNKRSDEIGTFANWDGAWYLSIVEKGYRFDPGQHSNVAFFPAFPLLARWFVRLTGSRPDAALLVVSHLSLIGTFVLLGAYIRRRGSGPPGLAGWVLVALGLWPVTFFCRMAYSESLFLLCTVAALYGIERRWPLIAIAVVCGLATATRSVGVCLLLPFCLHLFRTSTGWRGRALRVGLVPIACWGILAFMVFQHWEFDDAFAFVHTQDNWRMRPAVPWTARVVDLLTLEPVRSVFDPTAACYWRRFQGEINSLFSLHYANPIYWLAAVILVGVGVWKQWLTAYELTLSIGLLSVPYVLRSHEMCMAGMGRFTAVVFPLYIVLGHLLVRMPAPVAAMLAGVSALFLGTYAALFATWWRFF